MLDQDKTGRFWTFGFRNPWNQMLIPMWPKHWSNNQWNFSPCSWPVKPIFLWMLSHPPSHTLNMDVDHALAKRWPRYIILWHSLSCRILSHDLPISSHKTNLPIFFSSTYPNLPWWHHRLLWILGIIKPRFLANSMLLSLDQVASMIGATNAVAFDLTAACSGPGYPKEAMAWITSITMVIWLITMVY